VRPGLTDPVTLASIDEENLLVQQNISEIIYVETVLPKKVLGYVTYIESKSIGVDIRIIFQTAVMVAKRIVGVGFR
jgi:lipopolysaccharide/colanic/teichoic acid biosynthesis glycosyltransferase